MDSKTECLFKCLSSPLFFSFIHNLGPFKNTTFFFLKIDRNSLSLSLLVQPPKCLDYTYLRVLHKAHENISFKSSAFMTQVDFRL